jgi:hypothetical protein
MKCLPGNYFFEFVMPLTIFIMNWRTMKNNKIYIEIVISILLMLIVTIAFNYLVTILNIDRPFILPSGFLAI